MDQQKLVELLQATQIPDTQRVKAATAELRKNFYPHPEALLGLLHIVVSHPEPTIRMLAAVQGLRLVPKHWGKIDPSQKANVRNELLQAIVREQESKCRHGESRVVAAIASIDLEANEWSDLLPNVFQLTTSDNVAHREVGSYITYSLLEANPTFFDEHLPKLFELFSKTIRDPESRDVRVNTMMSISAVLMLIDADEDEQALHTVQEFIPPMVDVLKDAVENKDDERIQQSFEVFQSFLAYESALIAKYFKDLVLFIVDLAANTNADNEVRSQALAFLAQCIRYRRMKIQGIPELSSLLMKKALAILSEIDDDEDEDDETTPARAALALIDQLASDLPPRQVIVPLLDEFPHLASAANPGPRKAAILALGNCAEGAPDFVSTQISSLMPSVLNLLQDQERSVRLSALQGLMRLGEDLTDSMTAHHDAIVTALVRNLEAAGSDNTDKKNADIIRAVCGAVDSMAEGLGSDIMNKYGDNLIKRIGGFLNYQDPKVRAAAAGALGAIASSIKTNFIPYLKETMNAMSPWLTVESGEDELALRAAVCDSMGRIASGVGAQEFRPYVMPLLHASEKALHLGNPNLRETTFILWSQMARVFGGELGESLNGIFQGLFASLELEEEDVELNLTEAEQGLVDQDILLAGKKFKVKAANGEDDDEDDMDDDDDDDDDDFEDIIGVSAAALEKEIALEVLGDVIYSSKERSMPFIEKAIELVTPFAEHSYEGCRKTAIGTLWRTYACIWEAMEAQTGQKWEPGLPLKVTPSAQIANLGEIVTTATLQLWQEESDRDVVTEINRSVAWTIRSCGPAILGQANFTKEMITVLGTIITRSHPSQQDLGDEDEGQEVEGSSEWDWLIIDTALDVVIGLAAALGTQFAELWKIFSKPILKFISSQEPLERSTAVGVVAECVSYMGSSVTPFTSDLLRPLLHRLSDEDKETKSNAAYATGQLVLHSEDSNTYLPSYPNILAKLEPLLRMDDARLKDNGAGCVSRMILAHPDQVPIEEVLPALVNLLPLKEDYEENKPVYQCLRKLYEMSNPTVQNLTPQLLGVFQQVLGPPEDQLEPATRNIVEEMVRVLSK